MRTLLFTRQLLASNPQASHQFWSAQFHTWFPIQQIFMALLAFRRSSIAINNVYNGPYGRLNPLRECRFAGSMDQEVDVQDHLKKTLEEDEERHGEHARDRDTGEELEEDETVNEKDEKNEKKDKDKDNKNDDDDEGGGGLLMPVIEWIGGLIPRVIKEPNKG